MVSAPPPPFRLFTRPALVLAFALGTGIALGAYWLLWGGVVVFGVVLSLVVSVRTRNRLVSLRKLVVAITAVLVTVALGGLSVSSWQHLDENHIGHFVAATDSLDTLPEASLIGHIAEPVEELSYGTRLVLEIDSAGVGHTNIRATGRVQVLLGNSQYGNSAVFPTLRLGDRIWVSGELRAASGRRNPAEFDYAAYLQQRGIYGVMSIYEDEQLAFISPTANSVTEAVHSARASVAGNIARFIRGDEQRAISRALLLGDRSAIDASTRSNFAATGLMHLLAVSGLHVLLVGFLLYRLLKPLLGRLGFSWRQTELLRTGITLLVLLFYVMITGGAVSVQRAFIMACVWMGATVFQRSADGLNTLGVAAILVLLVRPVALFDVGFQLSFSAVAALIVLMPVFRSHVPAILLRHKLTSSVVGLVLTSLAATLGTAPVVLYHFGYLPFAGLVLNIVAIPATAVSLFGSLGAVLFGSLLSVVADAFAAVSELGSGVMLWTSTFGSTHLEWTRLALFVRDPFVVLTLVAVLATLGFWVRPRLRWRFVGLCVLLISLSAWTSIFQNQHKPDLDVVFLDVGQGDATFIQFPDGRTMLIDVGLRNEHTDHGSRTILPHLRRHGIERIDALVLTHADADHFGGALSVMQNVKVGRLIHNGHQKDNNLWVETIHLADSLGVPQRVVQAGDSLFITPTARVRVLHPTYTPQPWENGNDASVVLRVEYGEISFLFTGDTELLGESSLVSRYDSLLASTVVKVGHHGSRTSSSPAFVEAASDSTTAFAVISVARRNRYGLPNTGPVSRWDATPAQLLQTAEEGAIWLKSDGSGVTRYEWY